MSKYVDFVEDITYEGRTKKYHVLSANNEELLGCIKWYSAWRRYCFFPKNGTLYDSKCMMEIIDKISYLEMSRKVARNE